MALSLRKSDDDFFEAIDINAGCPLLFMKGSIQMWFGLRLDLCESNFYVCEITRLAPTIPLVENVITSLITTFFIFCIIYLNYVLFDSGSYPGHGGVERNDTSDVVKQDSVAQVGTGTDN